jgi:hypothetical protein
MLAKMNMAVKMGGVRVAQRWIVRYTIVLNSPNVACFSTTGE